MNRVKQYSVEFHPFGKRIKVPMGTLLSTAGRLAGIRLSSDCGGEGRCGRCRVVVLEGKTNSAPAGHDEGMNGPKLSKGYQLACRLAVNSDMKIELPVASVVTDIQIMVEGRKDKFELDPVIQRYDLDLPPPSFEDSRSDMTRIVDSLRLKHGITGLTADVLVFAQLSRMVRKSNWKLSVVVRDRQIIGFLKPGARALGVAVDLGTSSLAAYLIDMQTGKELMSAGCLNPQIAYGEDVVTRIALAGKDPDANKALTREIQNSINDLIQKMITKTGADSCQVTEVCLVANTAMTHMFLGLEAQNLAKAPFVSVVDTSIDVRGAIINLDIAPGAFVHILPGVGGFVGTDFTAMLLACRIDRERSITVGVDIGTNTEIILAIPDGSSYRFLAGSCASGPAFEGAHISDGMRSSAGAIEKVRITDDAVQVKTIGGQPAIGICGSGLVDAIAEMLQWGIIEHRGNLSGNHPHVQNNNLEYLLVRANQSGSGKDIVITRRDIDRFQLAKAAINSGIKTLLQIAGISENEIGKILVAGAFGNYMDLKNAIQTGLLPDFPNAEYIQVGNAAGIGATMALLSKKERAHAQRIVGKIEHIELAGQPNFSSLYARSLRFPD